MYMFLIILCYILISTEKTREQMELKEQHRIDSLDSWWFYEVSVTAYTEIGASQPRSSIIRTKESRKFVSR